MGLKSFIVKNVLRIKPGTVAADAAGELRVDSAESNKLKYHNGTSEAQIIRADQISDITYDGTTSGLAATNAKSAIDEVDSNLDSHLADTTAAHAASAIAVTPTGNLAADDVQEGLTELQGDIDGLNIGLSNKVDAIVSVDNTVPRFDGIAGQVQTSGITVDDTDNVSGVADLTMTGDIDQTGTMAGIATSNTASTVNIATGTGANTINIGGANTTINMTGTVNNQNVTNLNVTDKLVTINDGGAAASGAVAGIEVEEDGVATGKVVTSSDRNSWEFVAPNTAGIATLTPGASNDVVTLNAATQTLTNKTLTAPTVNGGTIDGGTASNTNKIVLPAETTANLDALTDDTGSVAYDTTKGKPVYNDGSNWRVLGSGSGVGGISYFEGIDLATDTTNISTYDDTGAYVDGTGGSPAAITIARNTTTPLDADGDLQISKAASDGTGEGVTLLSDTVDIADRGRKLWVSFEWDGTDANYTSEDLEMYAYDVTNSSALPFIPVSGFLQDSSTGVATLPNIKTKVLGYIIPPESCTSMRVSLHLTSDSATGSAWDAYVARPKLSPEATVPGAIVTAWQDFPSVAAGTLITATTTSPTYGTIVSNTAKWRRNGPNMEILWNYRQSTAGTTGTGAYLFNIPNNLQIDTTVANEPSQLPTATLPSVGGQKVGQAKMGEELNGDTTFVLQGDVYVYDETRLSFNVDSNAGPATQYTWGSSSPVVFGAAVLYTSFFASVPIQGWSASAALTTTEIGLQTVQVLAEKNSGTHTATGAAQTVASYTSKYDNFNCFNATTGEFTAPKEMTVSIDFNVRFAANPVSSIVYIQVNSDLIYGQQLGTGVFSNGMSTKVRLAKGDVVKALAYQASGGNLNYNTDAPGQTRLSITEVPDFTTFAAFKDNADVELWMDSPTGHGSTNTKIRNGFTVRKSTGSGVYYDYVASSATDGASVTIKVPGLYQVNYADVYSSTGGTSFGVSVNSAALTTSIVSISYADGFRGMTNTPAAGQVSTLTTPLRLAGGDVVRAHTAGVVDGTANYVYFQLIRIGD